MRSTLISQAAWHTQDDSQSRQEPVETRHARCQRQQHDSDQGDVAFLSEVAAPKPAVEKETGDDLEKEEDRASHADEDNPRGTPDEELTEVAAPQSVTHTSSSSESPEPPPDTDRAEKAEAVHTSSTPPKRQSIYAELSTVSWLVFFSLWGTLARLGVEAITTYPYQPVDSTVVWANGGGSFVLGFLLEDRKLFQASVPQPHEGIEDHELQAHIKRHKKTLRLYIGLATGFCGSFTSFSSFITDAFLALSNRLAPADPISPYHTIAPQAIKPRNGGYSFEAVVAILLTHPALSICALKTGAHLAVGLEKFTPTIPRTLVEKYLDRLIIVLGFGCWLGAILLTVWPAGPDWRQRATTSLVFAPPGCLLRFYTAKYLNACIPSFPLGTFFANILGTCVEAVCYDLRYTSYVANCTPQSHAASCAVLEGIMQGFCGCLTTVSTWVAELDGLRRRHGWFYGLVTVSVAVACQVAIIGPVAWTVGFN